MSDVQRLIAEISRARLGLLHLLCMGTATPATAKDKLMRELKTIATRPAMLGQSGAAVHRP